MNVQGDLGRMLVLFLLNHLLFKLGMWFLEKGSVMRKLKPLDPQFVDVMDFLTKAYAGLPAGYTHFSLKESKKFELDLR